MKMKKPVNAREKDPAAARRFWPWPVLALLLAVAYGLSIAPFAAAQSAFRYVLHFVLSLLLTVSLTAVLRVSCGWRLGRIREMKIALIMAVAVEASQVFLPLHSPDFLGLTMNLCGVVTAMGAITLFDVVRAGLR